MDEIEAERRRLATLIEQEITASLNLLLAQINAYEPTFRVNAQTNMALSILKTLTQNTLQRVRDLQANLNPTVLETLGLEAALEAYTQQRRRVSGFDITLNIQRFNTRPPYLLEMLLFRACQHLIERDAHATKINISLSQRQNMLSLDYHDNGFEQSLSQLHQHISQASGRFTHQYAEDGLHISITFMVEDHITLTPREVEIVECLAAGLSNKAIAQHLSITPRTVNFHLDNIYSKLGVNTRTEAVVYALAQGWIKNPG